MVEGQKTVRTGDTPLKPHAETSVQGKQTGGDGGIVRQTTE